MHATKASRSKIEIKESRPSTVSTRKSLKQQVLCSGYMSPWLGKSLGFLLFPLSPSVSSVSSLHHFLNMMYGCNYRDGCYLYKTLEPCDRKLQKIVIFYIAVGLMISYCFKSFLFSFAGKAMDKQHNLGAPPSSACSDTKTSKTSFNKDQSRQKGTYSSVLNNSPG